MPSSGQDTTPRHTPGPWVVHQRNHYAGELWLDIGYRLDDGTERGPVCDVTGKRYVEPHACDFRSVGEIKYLVTPAEEQWANAHLIAAAPTMAHDIKRTIAWYRVLLPYLREIAQDTPRYAPLVSNTERELAFLEETVATVGDKTIHQPATPTPGAPLDGEGV